MEYQGDFGFPFLQVEGLEMTLDSPCEGGHVDVTR